MDQNTNANTFSIRTYEDDVKGNPSQTGNFEINKANPAMQQTAAQPSGPPPIPNQDVPPAVSPPLNQPPVPPQPESPLAASIAGTPAVPDIDQNPEVTGIAPPPQQSDGRAGLASSAMESMGGKSRTKLYITIGAIVIIFALIGGGIYYLQSSSSGDGIMGSIRSLLGFEDTNQPDPDPQPETDPDPEDTGNKLVDVEKVIPNTFGYYTVTKKGTDDPNGMAYDMIQSRLLENTFTAEVFTQFEIDHTNDFIWNTEEIYFIPDGQEMPSHNTDSKDGLLVMSIDYAEDAADFFKAIKENTNFTTEEDSITSKEIWNLKTDTNATLHMVEFEDYLLISPDKTVITNSLDLISKSNSNESNSSSANSLDDISAITHMKMVMSDNLQNQLSPTETLNINFREQSFTFPASVVDWQSLTGIYLFAVLEDTKINYTIGIDQLTQEFQAFIPQWEQGSFEHLKNFYTDITISGAISYVNEEYKGFFKRQANLADFGSPREASITYVVMDDVIFIGTTPTVFDKVVDAHLNSGQSTTSDSDTNTDDSSDSTPPTSIDSSNSTNQ